MNYVIPPAAPVGVPVVGSDALFPVRRVFCVGRNYAAHAREMGADERDPPFFFCKPPEAVVIAPPGRTVELPYPALTQDYQHEVELVVALGRGGRDIPVARANEHVWGYGVGLDMTRRDLQGEQKKQGRPWEVGKAFDHSAPLGALTPAASFGHPTRGSLWLEVDGVQRQRSDLSLLIWSIPETIANLSTLFTLLPGDVIYSGTPEGVKAVTRGQTLRGGFDGLAEISLKVV